MQRGVAFRVCRIHVRAKLDGDRRRLQRRLAAIVGTVGTGSGPLPEVASPDAEAAAASISAVVPSGIDGRGSAPAATSARIMSGAANRASSRFSQAAFSDTFG